MSVSQSIPCRDTPTGPAADAARVEQAIATVLQAEQAARLAIEAAARDAEAEHIAAREAARLGRAPVEVIPGGGVRAANARAWLAVSPHLHASCRREGVFSAEELANLAREMRA